MITATTFTFLQPVNFFRVALTAGPTLVINERRLVATTK